MNCNKLSNYEMNKLLLNKSEFAYKCLNDCLKSRTMGKAWMKSFRHLELSDIYQETLIKIWAYFQTNKKQIEISVENFKACGLAVTIFKRTMIDNYRKEKNKTPIDFFDEEDQKWVERLPGIEDGSIQNFEDNQLIGELLDQLPERQAMLIKEHYINGTPMKELAENSGKDYTALQNDKNRALTRLRKELIKIQSR